MEFEKARFYISYWSSISEIDLCR